MRGVLLTRPSFGGWLSVVFVLVIAAVWIADTAMFGNWDAARYTHYAHRHPDLYATMHWLRVAASLPLGYFFWPFSRHSSTDDGRIAAFAVSLVANGFLWGYGIAYVNWLRKYKTRKRLRLGLCKKCGYDLRGSTKRQQFMPGVRRNDQT